MTPEELTSGELISLEQSMKKKFVTKQTNQVVSGQQLRTPPLQKALNSGLPPLNTNSPQVPTGTASR